MLEVRLESPGNTQMGQMEQLAPPPDKRFAAVEQTAKAGILAGTCMMPILPEPRDDANLRNVVSSGTAQRVVGQSKRPQTSRRLRLPVCAGTNR
jgi:DNA repair photolyase